MRPRVVYTRSKVQNDVKRILDLYRRSGRFAASVEPKIVQLPQNRVDLVFEINEGDVTTVRAHQLRRQPGASATGACAKWCRRAKAAGGAFSAATTPTTPTACRSTANCCATSTCAQGYADFRVVSAVAELTPDREAFYITFTIEEGERYRFADIDLDVADQGDQRRRSARQNHHGKGRLVQRRPGRGVDQRAHRRDRHAGLCLRRSAPAHQPQSRSAHRRP